MESNLEPETLCCTVVIYFFIDATGDDNDIVKGVGWAEIHSSGPAAFSYPENFLENQYRMCGVFVLGVGELTNLFPEKGTIK